MPDSVGRAYSAVLQEDKSVVKKDVWIVTAFMDRNFLLRSETARRLFEVSESEPIFDFHCHLSPKEIYEDKHFDNLAVLWLGGDHYKWRVMRAFGIEERYITGDAPDYEKFRAWSGVLPFCIGNPLYHWTHLELQRYFGIETPLTPKTADEIWAEANRQIAGPDFTPRAIIRKSNVTALCTTDDPVDSLEYHKKLAEDKSFPVKVLPAFRPDMAFTPGADGFAEWLRRLSEVSGVAVTTFQGLLDALSKRIEFFAETGCVASDHSFARVPFRSAGERELNEIYGKAYRGETLDACELEKYRTALLTHLASEYHKHNIVMELHIGALRNNSEKMLRRIGPNTGYDSMNDLQIAEPVSEFLSGLEMQGNLPKTVFYTLNPKDNDTIVTMAGNFQSSAANMQFGSAWWFNDHIDGMRRQLRDFASNGVLGTFIGMVTDSRSFLSYPRHEYFRRILCDLLGGLVENGEYPADYETLSEIVRGISYRNAVRYFGVGV